MRMLMIPLAAMMFALAAGCDAQRTTAARDGDDVLYYYTVQDGDTNLRDVSRKVYGEERFWTVLARENPRVNASALITGERLTIPTIREADATYFPRGCDRTAIY